MGTIGKEFLTNVSEIIKTFVFGTTETRTADLLLENPVVLRPRFEPLLCQIFL